LADFSKIKNEGNWQRYKRPGLFIHFTYHHMLQQQSSPTLEALVSQVPSLRDIPSLSEDQAKHCLHKARCLLNATEVAFQQLHNWSLQLKFEGQAVVEQSRLNNNLHNKQLDALTKILDRMSELNKNPFKAIIDQAAKDLNGIEAISCQINNTVRGMGDAKKITNLTTWVKKALRKLDSHADDFNALCQQIYHTVMTC